MATLGRQQVYRQEVSVSDALGATKPLFVPNLRDLSLYVVGAQASAAIVEYSFSNADQINAASGDVWATLDASLAAVGTTPVVFNMAMTPVAIRLRQLAAGRSATLVLTGRGF